MEDFRIYSIRADRPLNDSRLTLDPNVKSWSFGGTRSGRKDEHFTPLTSLTMIMTGTAFTIERVNIVRNEIVDRPSREFFFVLWADTHGLRVNKECSVRIHKCKVLHHNDVIYYNNTRILLITYSNTENFNDTSINPSFFHDIFLGRTIGEGSFAYVCKAFKVGPNGRIDLLALKRIDSQRARTSLAEEIVTMKAINHPNIIELIDSECLGSTALLLLPFMAGGTVEDLIHAAPDHLIRETQVGAIFRGVMCGLDHLQLLKIAHRDIKGANVLLNDNRSDFPHAIIADFGRAKHGKYYQNVLGDTQFYTAPEIWLGKLDTTKVDLWSAGVLLFQMIRGELPFGPDNNSNTLKVQVINAQFNRHIPPLAKNQVFLMQVMPTIIELLKINPDDRSLPSVILRKAWLNNEALLKGLRDNEMHHQERHILREGA